MPDNNFVTIQIEGLDKLIAKIKKLEELDAIKPAMKAGAEHIKGTLDDYPPSGPWNSPMSRNWYERGYGPHWTLKDGTVHSRRASQMLNRSWSISQENGGLTQIVGTKVSYGPFVMDEDKQTWFHKAHGWKTIQTVAREQTAKILQLVRDALQKIIDQR